MLLQRHNQISYQNFSRYLLDVIEYVNSQLSSLYLDQTADVAEQSPDVFYPKFE